MIERLQQTKLHKNAQTAKRNELKVVGQFEIYSLDTNLKDFPAKHYLSVSYEGND